MSFQQRAAAWAGTEKDAPWGENSALTPQQAYDEWVSYAQSHGLLNSDAPGLVKRLKDAQKDGVEVTDTIKD